MLKEIGINDLKSAEYNPRVALKKGDKSYVKLKRSLEEFGQAVPVVVNSDMTVIAGHQRLVVMKDMGYEKVECKVLDLDKTREKALNLALNKISGEWDNDKLAMVINDLMVEDVDINLTGFAEVEVAELAIEIENSTKSDFLDDVIEEAEVEQKMAGSPAPTPHTVENTTEVSEDSQPIAREDTPVVERNHGTGLEALNRFAEKKTEEKFEITLKLNKEQKENFIAAVELAKKRDGIENTYEAIDLVCKEWKANEEC